MPPPFATRKGNGTDITYPMAQCPRPSRPRDGRRAAPWFCPPRGRPLPSLTGNGELGMLAASSRLHFAAVLSACACTLAIFCAPAQSAQIDLSLNVFYTNPANTGSGGTWELV